MVVKYPTMKAVGKGHFGIARFLQAWKVTQVVLFCLILAGCGRSWNIRQVGKYPMYYEALSVAVRDNYAYVGGDDFVIFDISNPSKPALVSRSSAMGAGIRDIAVVGNYAYLVRWEGLGIMDISHPDSPQLVGKYDTNSRTWDVVVRNQYVYLTDSRQGLFVLDVSDVTQPILVTLLPYPTSENPGVFEVALVDHYAYLLTNSAESGFSDLYILDMANLTSPQLVRKIERFGCGKMVVVGTHGYLEECGKIRAVDLSNPIDPILLGVDGSPNVAAGIAVDEPYIYVASAFNLHILDFSNPHQPEQVGFVKMTQVVDVAVANGYVYAVDQNDGFYIFRFRP